MCVYTPGSSCVITNNNTILWNTNSERDAIWNTNSEIQIVKVIWNWNNSN